MSNDDKIFLFGVLLVVVLIVLHYDPNVLATLFGAHKGISVVDDKLRDIRTTPPPTQDPR